ncbi:helix-turn-helix transcriptional regulator [Desulfofundulus sp. TPOSR]|uniref:helix-turn-helix domain-containing protein n=1 Tax=Desulfofundulus sp. TPOSR TaxID=2714340 RepID=UPI00140B19CF|nr:helix-turn-helix transcriptional regulator [Desulfofundulus sp. TPOSR]
MISTKLRQLRKQRNYSLRARSTGLSRSFICDLEQGRCNLSVETLRILVQALGVTPDFFQQYGR